MTTFTCASSQPHSSQDACGVLAEGLLWILDGAQNALAAVTQAAGVVINYSRKGVKHERIDREVARHRVLLPGRTPQQCAALVAGGVAQLRLLHQQMTAFTPAFP